MAHEGFAYWAGWDDYLGVRGFFASGDYNTRVLLLVDGNRINDALYDQAMLGQRQRTAGALHADLVFLDRHIHTCGDGDRHFSYTGHFSFSSMSRV